MERLTEKHVIDRDGYYLCCSGSLVCPGQCDSCEKLGDIVDRLAHYEDLEEQGRLVILPAKEDDMDKQKPLKDWTLGEAKEYCTESSCRAGCVFAKGEDYKCILLMHDPRMWQINQPRFTEEEVADARAIMRLFGTAYRYIGAIEEDGETSYVLKETILDADGHYLCVSFPSILPGQSVKLSDIAGGNT